MNLKMAHQSVSLKCRIGKPRVLHIVEHLIEKPVVVTFYFVVVVSDYACRADVYRHGDKQRRNRYIYSAVAYLHIYIL